MKIVAKPIDVVATFIGEKWPTPYKFKYQQNNGEKLEIKIEQILETVERHIAGIDTIIYTCQSEENGRKRIYQLKYIIGEYRWELYKI
ncbi:hypothetical protein M2140_000177 [Clostridiales Family XIII bacterium PM5-7]